MPNQFVLKSNTGGNSEQMIIVKDKGKLNIYEAKMKMNEWLQPWNGAYRVTYHWSYVDIPQRIIAEEYIEEIEKEETDYSFFCSFGKILYIFVYNDKIYHINNRCIFLDENWNKLNIIRPGYEDILYLDKPIRLEEMKLIAKNISKDFPIVRVDFYNLKDKLLLGELTFYPAGGHSKFEPKEWDYKFGEMVDLDKIPTMIVIPAFIINELTIAFKMGIYLFIPFIVIDLVVASILMAMGMIMLPPIMISLPLKIILFVAVDGWKLLILQIVQSFQ